MRYAVGLNDDAVCHPIAEGIALEMVCIALRTGDCDDGVKQAIANKIIALASAGERNPDILCEQTLKDIRESQE